MVNEIAVELVRILLFTNCYVRQNGYIINNYNSHVTCWLWLSISHFAETLRWWWSQLDPVGHLSTYTPSSNSPPFLSHTLHVSFFNYLCYNTFTFIWTILSIVLRTHRCSYINKWFMVQQALIHAVGITVISRIGDSWRDNTLYNKGLLLLSLLVWS